MNIFVKKIFSKKYITKIDSNINLLGSSIDYNTAKFISYRLLTTILFAFVLLFFTNVNYIFLPFLVFGFYHLYYYIFITDKINKRRKKLDKEALNFFEILTLTLESGGNLETALNMTCRSLDSELSKEFERALVEVKFGKSLMEALEDLKRRIPSETINNIILNITQTKVFGNSIIDTMNNQINFLREKEILEIREQINKLPNKISIVSVLFVVPLILLIVLGPVVVEFIG